MKLIGIKLNNEYYTRKRIDMIEKIIALFHEEKPISYELKEIWNEENDHRWIVYVNFWKNASL